MKTDRLDIRNCDCAELMASLPAKSQHLIIVDPPYFEVKGGFDFVWASFDDYLQDVEKWAREIKRVMADNGTLLWWGHAKKIAYSQVILDRLFNLENVAVWEKTECQTKRQDVEAARCFAPITERLLMYSQDSINLTGCVTNIRDYIRAEITKAKGHIVLGHINEAMGTATNGGGVASACLSLDKGEPAMITAEMYALLQAWCAPHLRKEYEELRKEYEELRRPFNNYMKLTDVLHFSQQAHVTGTLDHPTIKPPKLCSALIRTCSKRGQNMLVPFCGSGSECIEGWRWGLNVKASELDGAHYAEACERIRRETAQQEFEL